MPTPQDTVHTLVTSMSIRLMSTFPAPPHPAYMPLSCPSSFGLSLSSIFFSTWPTPLGCRYHHAITTPHFNRAPKPRFILVSRSQRSLSSRFALRFPTTYFVTPPSRSIPVPVPVPFSLCSISPCRARFHQRYLQLYIRRTAINGTNRRRQTWPLSPVVSGSRPDRFRFRLNTVVYSLSPDPRLHSFALTFPSFLTLSHTFIPSPVPSPYTFSKISAPPVRFIDPSPHISLS
ncbi:hypothetical protein H4582DRAFT_467827 [Lactarius indigo]|nr:hypothetical protein H4582DRAFT_467827 [Lactarius indigo]